MVAVTELVKIKNFHSLERKIGLVLTANSRFHMTDGPLKKLSWPIPSEDQGVADFKPLGLWYSFGDSWLHLLMQRAEWDFWALERLDKFTHLYHVKTNSRRILRLETKADFR